MVKRNEKKEKGWAVRGGRRGGKWVDGGKGLNWRRNYTPAHSCRSSSLRIISSGEPENWRVSSVPIATIIFSANAAENAVISGLVPPPFRKSELRRLLRVPPSICRVGICARVLHQKSGNPENAQVGMHRSVGCLSTVPELYRITCRY